MAVIGKYGHVLVSVRYYILWFGEEMGCFESSDDGAKTAADWACRNGLGATIEAEVYTIPTGDLGREQVLERRQIFSAA